MGCSIHIITEIKKNGKWAYIPEVPEEFDTRNYKLFSLFANVRNYFGIKSFDVKGIPTDISATKFDFESYTAQGKERYYDEKDGHMSFITETGEIKSISEIPDTILSKEEYETLSNELSRFSNEPKGSEANLNAFHRRYNGLGWLSESKGIRTYYVKDATKHNGHFERVPYYKLYQTLEDFMAYMYEGEWDDERKEYGSWQIDFTEEDLHSHNHLSLKELVDADYTDFFAIRYKMDKTFYDEFIRLGGILPDGMKVIQYEPTEFTDIIRESFNPTMMIAWDTTEDKKNDSPLFKGIAQLKEIAAKYEIEDYSDIRIVFAFDN